MNATPAVVFLFDEVQFLSLVEFDALIAALHAALLRALTVASDRGLEKGAADGSRTRVNWALPCAPRRA